MLNTNLVMFRFTSLLITITTAVLFFFSTAAADDSAASEAAEKDWRFFLTTYFWIASVNGTVVTEGTGTEIDVPVDELAKRTNSALMLYGEARWRKWFLGFDGTWAELGDKIEGSLLNVDVDIEQRVYDIRIGRELYRRNLGEQDPGDDARWQRQAFVDLFAGARYFYTKPTITITSNITGNVTKTSSVDDRWDPIIGLRGGYAISKRWWLFLRGDIGGFGIGNAAQFTWQATADVAFRLSPMFSVYAGYRALSHDTVEGEGVNRSGADLLQYGPLIGLGVSF